MESKTINAGHWIIAEKSLPAYFLYKLKKGRVGIYEAGEKIASVEVKKGDLPKIIGLLSVLSDNRAHKASVVTETEVEVDKVYIDQIRGQFLHELPAETRAEVKKMIDTIIWGDRIKSLRKKIEREPATGLTVPGGLKKELAEVIDELKNLHLSIVSDPEIMAPQYT